MTCAMMHRWRLLPTIRFHGVWTKRGPSLVRSGFPVPSGRERLWLSSPPRPGTGPDRPAGRARPGPSTLGRSGRRPCWSKPLGTCDGCAVPGVVHCVWTQHGPTKRDWLLSLAGSLFLDNWIVITGVSVR